MLTHKTFEDVHLGRIECEGEERDDAMFWHTWSTDQGILVEAFGQVSLCINLLTEAEVELDDFEPLPKLVMDFQAKGAEIRQAALVGLYDAYQRERASYIKQGFEDERPSVNSPEELSKTFSDPVLRLDPDWVSSGEGNFILAFSASYEGEHGIAVKFLDWRVVEVGLLDELSDSFEG